MNPGGFQRSLMIRGDEESLVVTRDGTILATAPVLPNGHASVQRVSGAILTYNRT